MEPIFTMQYGEFAVADYLSKKIKDSSVFIPTSAQQKGIDMLLYRYVNDHNTTNTIQVKMSRTYYKEKRHKGFTYNLWFNRFDIQENANWYILVGIYARFSQNANARAKSTIWDTICWRLLTKRCKCLWIVLNRKKILRKTIKCLDSDLMMIRLFIRHEDAHDL